MGKGKTPKNVTTTSTNETKLPAEVSRIISASTPYVLDAAKNYKPYSNDRVANLTPDQVAANKALEIAAQQSKGMNQQAVGAYGQGLSLLTNPFQNPAYDAALQAAIHPIQDQFTQTVLPNIRTSSVSSGQYGGSRQDLANNIASQGFLRQVGDTSGQLSYDTYNRGLTAGLQTLALGPQIGQQLQQPGQMLATAGGVQQNQAQAETNAKMDAYNEKMLGPYQLALQSLSAAAGIPGGSSTNTTNAPGQQGPGIASKLIGGAASGAALGSLLPAVGGPWGAAAGAVLSLFS